MTEDLTLRPAKPGSQSNPRDGSHLKPETPKPGTKTRSCSISAGLAAIRAVAAPMRIFGERPVLIATTRLATSIQYSLVIRALRATVDRRKWRLQPPKPQNPEPFNHPNPQEPLKHLEGDSGSGCCGTGAGAAKASLLLSGVLQGGSKKLLWQKSYTV